MGIFTSLVSVVAISPILLNSYMEEPKKVNYETHVAIVTTSDRINSDGFVIAESVNCEDSFAIESKDYKLGHIVTILENKDDFEDIRVISD